MISAYYLFYEIRITHCGSDLFLMKHIGSLFGISLLIRTTVLLRKFIKINPDLHIQVLPLKGASMQIFIHYAPFGRSSFLLHHGTIVVAFPAYISNITAELQLAPILSLFEIIEGILRTRKLSEV